MTSARRGGFVLGAALLLVAVALFLVRDFFGTSEPPAPRDGMAREAPNPADAPSLAGRPAEPGTSPPPPAVADPPPQENATIRGRVFRSDGESLPRGWLAVSGALGDTRPARLLPLDARGEFETIVLAPPEGFTRITALLEGFPPLRSRAAEVFPERTSDAPVEIPNPPPIRARVVDPSGAPLRGATILLVASDFDEETLSVEGQTLEEVLSRIHESYDFDGFVRTDDDGAFEYWGYAQELAGMTLDRRWLVEGEVDPRARRGDLRARPNGGVEVRFTDAVTGGPASGTLVVRARRPSGAEYSHVRDEPTLEWFFPTDGEEDVALVVESARYRRREATLSAAAPRRLTEIALEPRAANEVGRVVVENEFRDPSGAHVALAVSWILDDRERSEWLVTERRGDGSAVVNVPAGASALRAQLESPFGGFLKTSTHLRVSSEGETAWRPTWPSHGLVRFLLGPSHRGVTLEGPLDAEAERGMDSYLLSEGDPYVREGALHVPALPAGRWMAAPVPSKGAVEFTVVAGREVTVDLR